MAFSGVAANMGGVILAFIFVATLGTQGVATKILATIGVHLPNAWITSFWGLVTVYTFFQIPLMFLVMLPAIDGLKPAWREAVSNLGGTTATYWRRVGIPVLTPAALGGLLLLFANAFAAYATAYALTTQAGALVPVQIRFYLQGNTITGKANVGYALAAWMVLDHAGHDRPLPAPAPSFGAVVAVTAEVEEPLQLVPDPADVEAPVATAPADSSGSRLGRFASWVFLIAVCVYFMFPLLMLMRAGFQKGVPTILLGASTLFKGWTLEPLGAAIRAPGFGTTLWLSARLAVGAIFVTLALMLPTAMWVHLRIPKARGIVETLTVLPYVVPPIALVVGVIGAFQGTVPWFYRSTYLLVPFYAILAMPFTYRSLDAGIRAIDLRTLVDASRSLGAGWGTTMFRVLIPNMRASLLTSSFLTATIVLGEFTMASLTGKQTLPTFQRPAVRRELPEGLPRSGFVTLIVTVGLLAGVTFVTRRRGAASGLV